MKPTFLVAGDVYVLSAGAPPHGATHPGGAQRGDRPEHVLAHPGRGHRLPAPRRTPADRSHEKESELGGCLRAHPPRGDRQVRNVDHSDSAS